MRNIDVEEQLKRAAVDAAPDVLDKILSRCGDEKGKVIDMAENNNHIKENSNHTNNNKKSYRWQALAGLAAALVLAFSGYGYYTQFYAVDSVVGFDVNPSIELHVSRQEKVLSATALNDDAARILDGMDLSGSNLNVAVNALIGSMLKNGYIDELKNSILVTVENKDTQKSRQLQADIVEEIDSILNANSINGSILSQSLAKDSTLQKLASAHNVSIGKAALIQDIVSQNPLLTFEDLVKCSIYELDLIAETKDVTLTNVQSTGSASEKAYIGEEAARNAALTHAGLNASAITFDKVKLDWDDGMVEYEVEFHTDTAEYEYDIDAVTGAILKYDVDQKHSGAGHSQDSAQTNDSTAPAGGQETAVPGSYIGEAKAKAIALEHAGLAEAEVTFKKIKLDMDDGKVEYEVEFYKGNMEYDYDIDAVTGAILSMDQDIEDDIPAPAPSSSPQEVPAVQPTVPSSYIGEEKARQIALLKVPGASITKFELDIDDDDPAKYEGEMKKDNMEYEFEIDAVTGTILKWEEEAD